MTRVQMTQAVAADYADAMLVARRAKSVLFFFLTLVLLLQLGVFFVVRYVPAVKIHADSQTQSLSETTSTTSTDSTSTATTSTTATGRLAKWNWPLTLRFWINIADFVGVVLSMVLPAVLFLIIAIMLVGRLVGVSHVTSAFCWSIVFLVILFPWQALLSSRSQDGADAAIEASLTRPQITFPGVLYTYSELSHDYNFPSTDWKMDWSNIVLKWMRFAGWPVVELIILMMVQARSSRGLRFALGEADVPVDTVVHTA
ncbi:MAG TPA: hypothetical protein VFE47_11100 [Tepidisphaeraceae bacterium]|nr:hypothetical protein [Tepidisphaeraceae bacterium]